MQAAHRQMHWRNAAPVVEGGVIVATPLDSPDMIGVDLESGAVLWSLGAGRVGRPRGTFNQPWYLMGAVGDTVYLGGRYVVARRARGGLTDQRGPTEETISEGLFGDGHSDAARLPRGILSAGHVIVPTRDRRVALDRRNLELEDPRVSGDWGGRSSGYGNLALGGGALVALSSGELSGVLEWSSVERLLEEELARHPEDAVAAVRLGEFLRERAARDLAEARFQGALAYLARAHRVLEKPLAAGRPEARLAEFEALRLEARVLTMEVQGGQALEPLERAVELAPDGPRLARVLAEFARAAQGRKPERFEAALARLDRECGDLEFPVEEHLPWTGARNVRRWVIEQRISDAATRGDFGREFAALVDLLDRCGDAPLSESEVPGETPTQRIGRRLAAGARERAAWQPFEERAREALTTARTSGDGAMLDRLLLVYPHTQAASQARDARLRLALAAGDAEGAMRTVFGELPRDWHAGNSTAREAQLLWLGARALGAAGNPLYTASVLQRLARELPDVQADSESPGVTFGSLARLPENLAGDAGGGPGAEDDASHFDSPAAEVFRREGDLVLLGRLDLGGRRVCVLGGRDSLSALNPDGTLLWSRALGGLGQGLSWGQSARLIQGTPATAAGPGFGGRIVIGWRRGLFAVDGTTGLDAWSWSIAGNLEGAVGSDAGVVIASASPEGAQRTLVGLDAARGIELWRRPVEAGQWPQPVLGGGLGVLLPRSGGSRDAAEGSSGQDAVVFELATGTLVRAVELGAPAAPEDRKAAWIEEGRLVLPRFGRSRENQDALTAFDLESGARAWRVPVDGTRTLDSIVRCKGQCYLVYLVSGPGSADGGLVELDTRLGATRPVPGVKLGPEDLPIGLKSSAVTELDEPFLFVRRAAPGGKETLVRAIHLPYGQRWAYRLPIPGGALYPGSFPLPAVTSRLVLLVYTDDPEVQGGRGQPSTQMVALDRESGSHRELRLLVDMGRSESIELATLENLLIVCGKGLVLALSGPTGEEQR
ncbi:MAG: PQQ-binding-like beta-propeller repeat protein [Planctomycetes bacterium]|nr:PQQ-binding-like beta-propeller repeat protein [Planctomycetota bacterium]